MLGVAEFRVAGSKQNTLQLDSSRGGPTVTQSLELPLAVESLRTGKDRGGERDDWDPGRTHTHTHPRKLLCTSPIEMNPLFISVAFASCPFFFLSMLGWQGQETLLPEATQYLKHTLDLSIHKRLRCVASYRYSLLKEEREQRPTIIKDKTIKVP